MAYRMRPAHDVDEREADVRDEVVTRDERVDVRDQRDDGASTATLPVSATATFATKRSTPEPCARGPRPGARSS